MRLNKKQLKSIFVLAIAFFLTIPLFAIAISVDNFQVSNSLNGASNPDMVWNGSVYGLTWEDSRNAGELEIYFTRVNEFGDIIGSEINISDNSDKISDEPAIIWAEGNYWSENNYAVVWSEYTKDENNNKENCNLYFTKLDKDGERYGGYISVAYEGRSACPVNPSIVWTGLYYGVVWQENNLNDGSSKVFFAKLNSLGEKQGKDIQITDILNSENPSIAWTGLGYGIVWQAGNEIYFVRLDADGIKQGNDYNVSGYSDVCSYPDIAYGNYYGIVWQGYDYLGNQQIYFAKFDKDGYKLTDDVLITSNKQGDYSAYPTIVWGNSEFGIVWQQGNGVVDFISVDEDGHKKSKITQVSDVDSDRAVQPIILSGGSQYAFAWSDTRSGASTEEIYFARIYFSEIAQNNLLVFLAFIKNLNSNSWIIIVLVLAITTFLLILLKKVKICGCKKR